MQTGTVTLMVAEVQYPSSRTTVCLFQSGWLLDYGYRECHTADQYSLRQSRFQRYYHLGHSSTGRVEWCLRSGSTLVDLHIPVDCCCTWMLNRTRWYRYYQRTRQRSKCCSLNKQNITYILIFVSTSLTLHCALVCIARVTIYQSDCKHFARCNSPMGLNRAYTVMCRSITKLRCSFVSTTCV